MASPSFKPITLHITWHFPPEQMPAFYAAWKPLHEQVVKEPQCMYVNTFEIPSQPGVIRLVEMWDCDVEWMMKVQGKKEYYKPFFEAVGKLALEPQKIEILKPIEGWKYVK